MQERNAIAVGGLVSLLLLLPLGYLFHSSPRFPGSLTGSMLGIAGATLMLVPLFYVVIKRIPGLKSRITKHISMRTLLAIHIYAGVLGPILGLIHSAHKFRSPLGVSLTGMAVIVVLTGYIGRYLLTRINTAVAGERSELAALTIAFESAISKPTLRLRAPSVFTSIISGLFTPSDETIDNGGLAAHTKRVVQVAEAMADVESAIRTEEAMRDLFSKWLPLHILVAILVYGLLALHVWSGLYYGLRW